MSEFFRTSTTWVVDFRYDGRPRRWFKLFGPDVAVREQVALQLQAWYGDRARLLGVRQATEEEETQYLRGEAPGHPFCPTGRRPPTEHDP